MAYRLPILAAAGVMLAAWAGNHFIAQTSAENEDAMVTAAPPSASQAQVDELLRHAIARLEQRQTLSAKMRLHGEVLGHTLLGVGSYAQGPVDSQQFRIQWRLQVDEHETSVQQISDGRFLWIQRQLNDQPATVGQVDLKKLPHDQPGEAPPGGAPGLLAVGGLARLLRSLDRSFDFTAALGTELDGVPMVAVRGDWNRESLLRLLPEQADAINAGKPVNLKRLPDQVPDHVVIFLGRDDLMLYRVDYRRTIPGAGPKDPGRSLMMIEWYDIKRDAPIPRSEFRFDPGQTPVVTETDQFIARLKSWQ